jgi:hypothetical protein
MISMNSLFKKILLLFIFQFIAIFMLCAQENRIKDSLTIEETWKLLSTFEKLSFEEGMDFINQIKYEFSDSISYIQLIDSILNFIYKDVSLMYIKHFLFFDSISKIIRDTLPFSFVINQNRINDYNHIKFFISYVKDGKRKVLKLQTIDSLIILPPHDQIFDSVYLILKYKNIYLSTYINKDFKGYYHLNGLEYIHETVSFYIDKYFIDCNYIRERARETNAEGFLYVGYIVYGDGLCSELLIPDIKKYYKHGKQLVKNK